MPNLKQAKDRLDLIIDKARVDLYKPVQVAEVLMRSRVDKDIDVLDLQTYKNPSVHWRDAVTMVLLGKRSTSSAQYQHNIWNDNAMPPNFLAVLDEENRRTHGLVERYIYSRFAERQEAVGAIFAALQSVSPGGFDLAALLSLFVKQTGITRSIDKAYEIVAYALFETIVTALEASVRVSVPTTKRHLLKEFADLAETLLGLKPGQTEWEQLAHIYRVGVTNAADRGLDMWANFGPAIQVKHLTLNAKQATQIVDQVESDQIIVVCRDMDAAVIGALAKQIGWGRRVRGIVKESDLVRWYERCLRGSYASELANPLLARLREGFSAEFPQMSATSKFIVERGYDRLRPEGQWMTETDKVISSGRTKNK